MKVRIFQRPDGTAVYNYPSGKYQNRIEECPIPADMEGLPFIVAEASEIPPVDSSAGDFIEHVHFDGDCMLENLKIDRDWNQCLMPTFLISQKHLAKLNERLDAELAKGDGADPLQAIRCTREKEKCAKFSEKEWHQQAVKNLDARVAAGEPDKPIIREKLLSKLGGLQ